MFTVNHMKLQICAYSSTVSLGTLTTEQKQRVRSEVLKVFGITMDVGISSKILRFDGGFRHSAMEHEIKGLPL